MSLASLRREYTLAALDVVDVERDPIAQFTKWFHEAMAAQVLEPNAMTLSTVNADGAPSGRVVLLKEVDARGLVFFTDYRSDKSRDLDGRPRAALTFFWKELERQVRVTGHVERVSAEESSAYYHQRPLGSRYGAWASIQSTVIPDRGWLESAVQRVEEEYAGSPPPRPEHWGGFRVIPDAIEFWQGRESRLHDRVRYRHRVESGWVIERLSP